MKKLLLLTTLLIFYYSLSTTKNPTEKDYTPDRILRRPDTKSGRRDPHILMCWKVSPIEIINIQRDRSDLTAFDYERCAYVDINEYHNLLDSLWHNKKSQGNTALLKMLCRNGHIQLKSVNEEYNYKELSEKELQDLLFEKEIQKLFS